MSNPNLDTDDTQKYGPVTRAQQFVYKVRQKGVRRSFQLAGEIASVQTKHRTPLRSRQYLFITHPMDNSGAPLVALQILREYAAQHPPKQIRLIAPITLPTIQTELKKLHIRDEKAALMSPRLTGLQLALEKNDFVLLNTVAVYDNYLHYIFGSLEAGKLEHAVWFIHEDLPQIKTIKPGLLQKEAIHKINALIESDKLAVFVPSKKIEDKLNEFYGTKKIKAIPLYVEVEKKYTKSRPATDYQSLDFLITGTPSDGRKGQLIAISAFHEFLNTSYRDSPKDYRDFSLHLVSVKDDYVSEQVKTLGRAILGKRLHIYPQLSKDKAMAVTADCNAVMCCSLNETFALYVAEGMMMGHVVLRNNTAGIDEQLREGVNGYYIDSDDIKQMATVLEKLLNKKKTSDEDLQKMGRASQKLIAPYAEATYIQHFE